MSTDRGDVMGQPSAVIRFYRASGAFGFLSNLFDAEISFEDRTFRSSEFAYQYGKPNKPEIAEWLMAAPKPHLCAAAAHALLRFDVVPDWSSRRVPRMQAVLRAKFTQHPELAEKLLATGDAQLVEASSDDQPGRFWGEGKNGRGANMLGILLMELRAQLQDAIVVASGDIRLACQVVNALIEPDRQRELVGVS